MKADEGSSNLNVYVDDTDGLIHFTNWAGADSALPFSPTPIISVITVGSLGGGATAWNISCSIGNYIATGAIQTINLASGGTKLGGSGGSILVKATSTTVRLTADYGHGSSGSYVRFSIT